MEDNDCARNERVCFFLSEEGANEKELHNILWAINIWESDIDCSVDIREWTTRDFMEGRNNALVDYYSLGFLRLSCVFILTEWKNFAL